MSASGSPPQHTNTRKQSVVVSNDRLPVSTEALINWGRAQDFLSLGTKAEIRGGFLVKTAHGR